jgi:hypothetical protein
MAWQTGRDWNPMNRLGNALNPFNASNPLNPFVNRALGLRTPTGPAAPRFGTPAYQNRLEGQKHQSMADVAFSRAEELRQKGDIQGANRLEQEAHDLMRLSADYDALSRDPATRDQRGDGEIAAKKPSYKNHNQIKILQGQKFDPATTPALLPPGYRVIELQGGRKLCGVIDPATGTFDMTQGIIRVKPNGTMDINPQNRISYDYNDIYRNDPRADPDVVNAGFNRDGYTIHHVTPDKVATGHPATVANMISNGYNIDSFENYAPLPMQRLFEQKQGTVVGHWSRHDNYDGEVNVSLDDIQRRLQAKYSAPVTSWENHPRKAEIAADLDAEILALQAGNIQRIEDGDVPMKDKGMPGGMGMIN